MKSRAFVTDMLSAVFLNLPIIGVGDAAGLPGSVEAGSLYVSIHSADPGEDGDQSAFEASYPGFGGRIAVERSAVGWTLESSGRWVANVSTIQFSASTGEDQLLRFFSVGYSASGASRIAYAGQLLLPVHALAGPNFAAGALRCGETS